MLFRCSFGRAVLLLFTALGICAGCRPQPGATDLDPSAHLADAPLRVMSFNLRYGSATDGDNAWLQRRELLWETIAGFDPDLLGTQECLEFQATFLRQRLPGHGFVGVGRDDGRLEGEMCALFFRTARFEQIAAGHFWLSETPEVVASKSWDSALTRMVSWIKLRTRTEPYTVLFFFNTHFDHRGEVARLESARLLRARVLEIAGEQPTIITGDFNAPALAQPGQPYGALCGGESPFRDTYRVRHPATGSSEGTFNGFRGVTSGPRIDWILTGADLAVCAADIVRTQRAGRFPSDHFPVTAVLRLPPKKCLADSSAAGNLPPAGAGGGR